jgi:hypothetical protein
MNITTIVPVHEFNEEVEKYLDAALTSVSGQRLFDEERPVVVVYASILSNNDLFKSFMAKEYENVSITYLKNENETDFQSQINFAVSTIDTEFFSILEYDDELSNTYYKRSVEYSSKLNHVDLFLPMIIEVDNDNNAMMFTNQLVWSKQFVGDVGEMGYLNMVALGQYTDFKISGAIFRKSKFETLGGLKKNIKLTFTLEMLYRFLNNGVNIYTIPKIGVKHLATREGSLFSNYLATMPMNERKFWFETAKKESNFTNDRVIDTSVLSS